MKNKYLEIFHHNKNYVIEKSNHTLHKRRNSTFTRDIDLLKEDYKNIIEVALAGGLTSLKGIRPEVVVLKFKDTKQQNYFTLIEIFENTICIISTLRLNKKSQYDDGYIKCRKRMFLNYVLPETYQGTVNHLGSSLRKGTIKCFKKISKIDKRIKIKKPREKYINQYKGKALINQFNTIQEASKHTNISIKKIRNCLNDLEDSTQGFIWKYSK